VHTYVQDNTNQSKRANETAASVMFWFWFFMQARIIVDYVFFYDNAQYATLLNGLVSLSFAALVIVLGITGGAPMIAFRWSPAAKLFLAFLLWSGITILWTRAKSPSIAFAYWAEIALEVFVVLILLRADGIQQIGEACLRGFVFGSALIAMTLVCFNPEAEVRGGLGDTEHLHPNFVAPFLALGSLFALHLGFEQKCNPGRRRTWWLLATFLFIILLRTLSKTTIVAFLLAAILYASNVQLPRFTKIKIACVLGAVLVAFFWSSWAYFGPVFYNDDNSTLSLTGRTLLWAECWQKIQERPLVGYGFFSYRDYGPQQIHIDRLTTAHNEWLMLWFQTGLIGIFLAAAIYMTLILGMRRALMRRPSWLPGKLALAVLAYALVLGTTEASMTDLVISLPLLLTVYAWALSSYDCRSPMPA
jgi:exopolysaccharide production protein ExoQ